MTRQEILDRLPENERALRERGVDIDIMAEVAPSEMPPMLSDGAQLAFMDIRDNIRGRQREPR
ncbi:hypothetical protein DFR50_104146 [Roseiarcus fermentans]|uniref:Uncharacterized protein n=1 Tax=Roseiarcus fermentans TaxID=1473586 RepID=A0A366FQH2_9HYPH|nr:hypothetical protein [Roseiarcus fermentans]RBP16868.1 hypothetical protein DFR50_104146 [Roseiarcus fermentans]